MSLKPLVLMSVVFAGLMCSATPAPAQDWWNPGTWFAPSHTYVARPTYYGTACSNGNCRPGTYGYQSGYVTRYAPSNYGVASCPGGNCAVGSCANGNCAKGNCGATVMPYRSTVPVYPSNGAGRYAPTYNSSGRVRSNPFYQ